MSERLLPARYSEVTHLASGGMGDVYSAHDSALGRTVAVKVLSERHARNDDVRARFMREARAAASLASHPNVVTVFDVGEVDGRPFIVMSYLDGGSVHDRLRESTVTPASALGWLEQAARALDAAHAQGIVHRDVKPANLLLDSEGRVHVSDFGIASAAGLDTLTLPGTVLGTAGYLSPEQARGEPATPASDRYALGVVAFELLTGARPYQSDTPVTEAFAHLNAEIPSAKRAAPGLPRSIDAVFDRALAKDPRDRPASAGELVEDLREAFREDEQATAVMAPPLAMPSERMSPGNRRALVPLALAALLLGGLATAAFMSEDDPPRAMRTRTIVTTVSDGASTITVTETATSPLDTTPDDAASGAQLNDEGFRLMQAEDFEAALPLLEEAVSKLAGTGSLAEAYASYNLAFTRFALGSCDGVLELLERSEEIQGERREIDRLRKEAEKTCEGDGRGRGNGHGNGNGKGPGGDD